MSRPVVLYRGSLKSCNYCCSYCPFSKRRASEIELQEDRERWLRFVDSLVGENPRRQYKALMVAPYGEALIHPWYLEGMARASRAAWMDAVGAQTNLSFSPEDFCSHFRQSGGRVGKLRLWATFHPEMVEEEEFAEKCKRLWEAGISLCAGSVGVPENIPRLRRLRKLLPRDIYLWVNKMDGLRRPYTEAERQEFLKIDPFFWRELLTVYADPAQCRQRMFVESDGKWRVCNIGKTMEGSWYGQESGQRREDKGKRECGRVRCSCYLAYGGRNHWTNEILFGPYPVFRIPRRVKAVFLDIDGTLMPCRNETEEEGILQTIRTLAEEKTKLFFATTLPFEDAKRRCKKIWQLFDGGVFAGGAHMFWRNKDQSRQHVYPIDSRYLSQVKALEKEYGFRLLTYQKGGDLYKLTLLRPHGRPWREDEEERLFLSLKPASPKEIRWIREKNCLQIVASQARKENGIRMICEWLGISLKEAAAAGDSAEDQEMLKLFLTPEQESDSIDSVTDNNN